MGFVYEHISLEDRAAIGMVAALSRGVYGAVTGMARELGTSRKFVYGLADRVRVAVAEAVAPCPPGPRPLSVSLELDRRTVDRAIVLAELRTEAERHIDRYEAVCTLGEWVAEALDAVYIRTGRLRGRGECLEELSAATELMRDLHIDSVRELADYLDRSGPALLAYADQLALPMARLARELGTEGLRMLCREWLLGKRLRHARGPGRDQARRELLRMRLLATLHLGADYPASRRRVAQLLEGTMRGSSLAECINSLLRPYAQVMRGLGERFLPLFSLYRNAHVFARGKRAGRSPFQLAGIDTPQGDWLDWLGLGRQTAPRRTVRALPRAA